MPPPRDWALEEGERKLKQPLSVDGVGLVRNGGRDDPTWVTCVTLCNFRQLLTTKWRNQQKKLPRRGNPPLPTGLFPLATHGTRSASGALLACRPARSAHPLGNALFPLATLDTVRVQSSSRLPSMPMILLLRNPGTLQLENGRGTSSRGLRPPLRACRCPRPGSNRTSSRSRSRSRPEGRPRVVV